MSKNYQRSLTRYPVLDYLRMHGMKALSCQPKGGRALFSTVRWLTLVLSQPSADLLDALANADSIAGEAGELESAWEQLMLVASIMDADAVGDEFNALFVSTGTPLISPHASLYLSGFMMDRPLASRHETLREFGMARRANAFELEDHLGSLCETMALLIRQGRPLPVQRAFFDEQIAEWAQACLDEIRNAEGANFHRHVAQSTSAFMTVEREAFEMTGAD